MAKKLESVEIPDQEVSDGMQEVIVQHTETGGKVKVTLGSFEDDSLGEWDGWELTDEDPEDH